MFVLLDLYAVPNAVDHNILLSRLEHAIGNKDTAMQWF